MQLTYEKPGKDHPKYGQVDWLVMDGTTPICYKTKDGYVPLEGGAVQAAPAASVNTQPLYVLSFKVNDEAEEMTFKSKKKLDKTMAKLSEKPFVTDLQITTYQVVTD